MVFDVFVWNQSGQIRRRWILALMSCATYTTSTQGLSFLVQNHDTHLQWGGEPIASAQPGERIFVGRWLVKAGGYIDTCPSLLPPVFVQSLLLLTLIFTNRWFGFPDYPNSMIQVFHLITNTFTNRLPGPYFMFLLPLINSTVFFPVKLCFVWIHLIVWWMIEVSFDTYAVLVSLPIMHFWI